jgi:hypothetical protein
MFFLFFPCWLDPTSNGLLLPPPLQKPQYHHHNHHHQYEDKDVVFNSHSFVS